MLSLSLRRSLLLLRLGGWTWRIRRVCRGMRIAWAVEEEEEEKV